MQHQPHQLQYHGEHTPGRGPHVTPFGPPPAAGYHYGTPGGQPPTPGAGQQHLPPATPAPAALSEQQQPQASETDRLLKGLLQLHEMEIQMKLQERQNRNVQLGGVTVPSYMLKHDHPPLFVGFASDGGGSVEERNRYTSSLHEFVMGAERWMGRRGLDPAFEQNHPVTRQLITTMFRGECLMWYNSLATWELDTSYNQLKDQMVQRYVPREEIDRLKEAVQRMRWDGKISMRAHCTNFQVAMQKLVVFAKVSKEQAWEWFRATVKGHMQVRMLLELHRWNEVTPVFQDAINTLCRVVDNSEIGSSSGGPTPMDISALTSQLQQSRLSRADEEALLAALGYDSRGFERGRGEPRGGWGAGPSGSGREGGRERTPDRQWGRSRTPDRQGSRSRTPDRRGDRRPRIEMLKQHRLWPYRLRNMTQEQVDECTRKGLCFVCEGPQHVLGWTNCTGLQGSSPGRDRGGSPNGDRPPSRGR
jgi:hypothetical protein